VNISVILAHPNKGGFNHATARTSEDRLQENGHDVIFHDLYDEKFDAILPYHEIPNDVSLPLEIEIHCEEISSADGIVIVHPNWWGQPPPNLKGWVGRVMRPDVAHKFFERDQGEGINGRGDRNSSIRVDIDRYGYGCYSPSGGLFDASQYKD